MPLEITSWAAFWFLPFVTPVCLWVMWSDLKAMRIPNISVLTLAGIFVVVGLWAVTPIWPDYAWRIAIMVFALVIGFIANAGGLMGAGDSKFIAAAAPFVAPADWRIIMFLFAANLLACFVTHRLAKHSPPAPAGAELGQLGPRQEVSHGLCPGRDPGDLSRPRRGLRGLRPLPHPCPRATIISA